MAIIVSVINNKGGVGKSTCSINLAHSLALKGHRILVVDMDSQSNTSSIFCPDRDHSLCEVLEKSAETERCIYSTSYENLFCLPNHPKTATLEVSLYNDVPESYFLLRKALRQDISDKYDICIIDCPPNLGIFVMQALICCDCVIVPVICGSRFSVEGLDAALEHIRRIKNKLNPSLFFLRLLVNQVDLRSTEQKAAVEALRTRFGEEMVFNTVIPRNKVFLQAEENKKTVIRESPSSTGAKNFRAMADEFIDILKLQKDIEQTSLFG